MKTTGQENDGPKAQTCHFGVSQFAFRGLVNKEFMDKFTPNVTENRIL